MDNFRNLTDAEIAALEAGGSSAENWSDILVADGFDPSRIRDSVFSGPCRIGSLSGHFSLPGGVTKPAGIYRATLHNVTVGDNVRISNVRSYIANYDIGDGAHIGNVDKIYVEGESSFGNGVEVSVLNEVGGREVTIHDRMTAHEAYIEAMYRHRPLLIERLKGFARKRAEECRSSRGMIGRSATVLDTGLIRNVHIGDGAIVDGVARLSNGSLVSRTDSPVVMGRGVIADDFIVQDGSSVEDCTRITRCYVGQACVLGHGYSASDSLFFCNCQEENGEACAVFAGPFTVTHHKSTLLIAGMFSFMNAGSGSNQSNHMYKLGPIHQGALERGAKTASDSYILWPARIGAFSLVMGRHTTNPDTSDLPFSYLIESNGITYLAPGVNLRSVGTIRDVQKWPKRDKRRADGRLDRVNFNLLSPYTIAKMVRGISVLEQLKALSGATSDTYAYQSARITNSALEKGLRFYRMAIDKFLGNSLISRLETTPPGCDYVGHLKPEGDIGLGHWVDLSGLIAPHSCVSALLDDIESGAIDSREALDARLGDLHDHYYEYEWTWAYNLMLEYYGLREDEITRETLAGIIRRWRESVLELDHMLYEDARKEFSLSAKTGFGFDGQGRTTEADFEEVRGAFETNPFVAAVKEHISRKDALGALWLRNLEGDAAR
ncbi:MAG: DUF4954 family protein [Kiritimatiellae bacterium]|nr:DUF4954 family protein [Kiritimatiellia bacterium]